MISILSSNTFIFARFSYIFIHPSQDSIFIHRFKVLCIIMRIVFYLRSGITLYFMKNSAEKVRRLSCAVFDESTDAQNISHELRVTPRSSSVGSTHHHLFFVNLVYRTRFSLTRSSSRIISAMPGLISKSSAVVWAPSPRLDIVLGSKAPKGGVAAGVSDE